MIRFHASSRRCLNAVYLLINRLVSKKFYKVFVNVLATYQQARLKEIFDGWKQEGAHVPVSVSSLPVCMRMCLCVRVCACVCMLKLGE